MRALGAWVSRGQPAPHLPQQHGRYRGPQGDPEVPTPTGLGTGEADIHDLAAPQPWDLARGWKTDHQKQTQEAREKLLFTKALSLRELDRWDPPGQAHTYLLSPQPFRCFRSGPCPAPPDTPFRSTGRGSPGSAGPQKPTQPSSGLVRRTTEGTEVI